VYHSLLDNFQRIAEVPKEKLESLGKQGTERFKGFLDKRRKGAATP